MISSFLDMRQRRGPIGYLVCTVILSAIVYVATGLIVKALSFNHHLTGISVFLSILVGGLCYSIYLAQTVRRLNDFGGAHILALLTFFPVVAMALLLIYGPASLTSGIGLAVALIALISTIYFLRPGKA